jgi:hypothetical protein
MKGGCKSKEQNNSEPKAELFSLAQWLRDVKGQCKAQRNTAARNSPDRW